MINHLSVIIISILKLINLFGNYLNNYIKEYKLILLHLNLKPLNSGSIFINIFPSNISKRKKINGFHLPILNKDLPENKSKLLSPIITHINKEISNITSGIASIFVPKTKRKNKLLLPGVTHN